MASIGPVANAIFTNQMTPAAATAQNANQNRVDFQNMIAQSQVQEKDEKVLEVRPAEENKEVDEDKEHTRDEADRENQRSPKHEDDDDGDDTDDDEPLYKLDIKV
ncbi:hypothetical protein JHD49_03505 [Sulfurimonas sp. SAG-AH-194-C21]|nr:hypothetical protein [Sulfurimonas sp. SAG-AH-194-C21]MDF1882996.1 hypothetical protein [Sulfurimonas sp. SAG-AH-194-C21]